MGAAWACLWVVSAVPACAAGLKVVWRNQHLSVESVGAPVAQVLAEIGRQTGLRVEGADSLRQNANAHFTNLPLGEALARLLRGVNFALVEHPCGPNGACPMTLIVLSDHSPQAASHHPDEIAQAEPGRSGDPDDRLRQLYEAAQGGDLQLLKLAASAKNTDATQAVALDLLAQRDPGAAASLALTASASSDLGHRVAGLQALAHVDNPTAVRVLGEALHDSDTGVRETALDALGQQPSPEAARLIRHAAEDPNPSIQTLAKSLVEARRGGDQDAPTGGSSD